MMTESLLRIKTLAVLVSALLLVAGVNTMPADVATPLPKIAGDALCPAYAWINPGEKIRESSGAITQRYHLRLAAAPADSALSACSEIDDWQPRYRISTHSRSGSTSGGAQQNDIWYSAPLTREGADRNMNMAITSPIAARVQLVITGSCTDHRGTHHYVAQTDQSLFGRAAASDPSTHTAIQPPPDKLPMLHLQPSRTNYYMQTGLPYTFTYTGDIDGVDRLSIIEDGRPLSSGPQLSATENSYADGPLAQGTFSYTSDHDRRLEKGGPYAVKTSVVLISDLSGADHWYTTFSMQLHRSILANIKPRAGRVLFGTSAFVTLSAILLYRRLQQDKW